MRILVAGYGSAGRRHAKNARELGHEVVISEWCAEAATRAKRDGYNVPLYEMLPEAISTVGAAVIATPARKHWIVAQSLERYGYAGPLFVEKPLDVNLRNADWWRDWPSPTVMCGFNWRFHPLVGRTLAAGIERDAIPFDGFYWCEQDMSTWPGKDYASVLLEFSHEIDLALMVHGPGKCVQASRRGDTWVLRLSHMSGNSEIVISGGEPQGCRGGTIKGKDAHYDIWEGGWDVGENPDAAELLEASYKAELAEFLAAAEAGRPIEHGATFADGLAVLKIVEEAERLAK